MWPPHARFHGVVALGTVTILTPAKLWGLWRRSPDVAVGTACAALLPMAYWGSFYAAALVPGTGLEDLGHEQPRRAGVPTNFLYATAGMLTAAGSALDALLRR